MKREKATDGTTASKSGALFKSKLMTVFVYAAHVHIWPVCVGNSVRGVCARVSLQRGPDERERDGQEEREREEEENERSE